MDQYYVFFQVPDGTPWDITGNKPFNRSGPFTIDEAQQEFMDCLSYGYRPMLVQRVAVALTIDAGGTSLTVRIPDTSSSDKD